MESFEKMRSEGKEVDIKKWHNIHARLRQYQKFAEQQAYRRLQPEMQLQLMNAQVEQQQKDQAQILGQDIQEFQSNMERN